MCFKRKKFLSLFLIIVVFLFTLVSCSSDNKSAEEAKQPTNNTKVEEKTISIEDLEKNLDNKDYTIVDLRKDEAYQGY